MAMMPHMIEAQAPGRVAGAFSTVRRRVASKVVTAGFDRSANGLGRAARFKIKRGQKLGGGVVGQGLADDSDVRAVT